MGGDALQIVAVHTAMAATAYLTNIVNAFLSGKPTQTAGVSLGLGSRLVAGSAPLLVSRSQNAAEVRQQSSV